MAEALRAKQSPTREAAPAGPEEAETPDLELAPVDDGTPALRSRPRPRAIAARSQCRPLLPPAGAADRVSKPAAGGREAASAQKVRSNQTDLLAGLLTEDELPPAQTLPVSPSSSGLHPHTASSRAKGEQTLGDILKSPWPWVAVAAVVLVLGLLLLLTLPGSTPQAKPGGPYSGETEKPKVRVSPTPSPVRTPTQPGVAVKAPQPRPKPSAADSTSAAREA